MAQWHLGFDFHGATWRFGKSLFEFFEKRRGAKRRFSDTQIESSV
jgi:hypothetical protein